MLKSIHYYCNKGVKMNQIRIFQSDVILDISSLVMKLSLECAEVILDDMKSNRRGKDGYAISKR